jgi:hypothetical protein
MKDLAQELALAHEIMTTIERFNGNHGIYASPGSIRDTLLIIAGLLHRDAIRLEDKEDDPSDLQTTFAEAARANIVRALEVSESISRSSPQ